MKTAHLVFLVVAGAALVKAAPKQWKPYCIDFITPPPTGTPVPPIDCPRCQAEAIANKCGNPDTYVPVCNGKVFAKYQYDAQKNEHFCYHVNGDEIPETRGTGDVDPSVCNAFPDLPAGTVETITICADKKAALGPSGTFISCEAEGEWKGFFSSAQKNGIYSWCTSPDGVMVPGTFTAEGETPADCTFFRNLRPECPGEGNFAVHWDCTRYISCCPQLMPHLCSCPDGLAWDDTLKICNHRAKVEACLPRIAGVTSSRIAGLNDVKGPLRPKSASFGLAYSPLDTQKPAAILGKAT